MEEERKPQNKKFIAIVAAAVVAVIAIIVGIIFAAKGANSNPIVGTWQYEDTTLPYAYVFKSDGTGSYGYVNSESTARAFEYKTVTENNDDGTVKKTIVFTYEGDTTPLILEYRFEDGNKKLIVLDSFGHDTVYLRK